jgi:hypothetical protein
VEKTAIQWNIPNWITVTLMSALGTMAFAAVLNIVRKMQADKEAPADE